MKIGKVIDEARELGWSDQQLAEIMEVSRETVRMARTADRDIGFSKGWIAWQIVRDKRTPPGKKGRAKVPEFWSAEDFTEEDICHDSTIEYCHEFDAYIPNHGYQAAMTSYEVRSEPEYDEKKNAYYLSPVEIKVDGRLVTCDMEWGDLMDWPIWKEIEREANRQFDSEVWARKQEREA